MVFDQLKQRRRYAKKEKFELSRLASCLSKKELKDIKKLRRQNKASIGTKKLPISFLISGENLIPQLSSNEVDVEPYNQTIRAKHFSDIRAEFSQRAYDVLPNFIAPELVGLSVEKRVASTLLFSQNLSISIARNGKEVLDFLSQFELESSSARAGKSDEGFDFVFKPKKPQVSPLLVYTPSEIRQANLAFIKDYAAEASQLSVKIPKDLDAQIEEFARSRMGSARFAEGVRELARALARMEMRSKLLNKDLARAFEIASASAKR